MTVSARTSHLYVIGMSGKGKSKLLEYCLHQDIAAGRGCGLIDPHSLLADDLLRLLITQGVLANPDIRNRLIYVDPARTDYVVPFNVLASAAEHPYDIAAAVLEAFRRTWPECLKEAPHFSNVVTAALIGLIENGLTLMHMPRLLTNTEFREQCLEQVTDASIVEFFHDRYDRWGKEAPLLRESTLNKIGAFSLNPRLKLMLGQRANPLNFRAIIDEGKILLLDLGRSDGETNRLIGSLVVTGLELAMRRRRNRKLWNLTIDEFAGYVANEGSVKTLAHVFSDGRKFRMSMTVAHQDLSQLTPRMLGALSNVQTKVVFGIGRRDAEYFAKLIGRVNAEAVKRDPKTETQHELFSSLPEQWEQWVDRLRFQSARQATVASQDGRVVWRQVVDYGIKRPEFIQEQVLNRQAELRAQGDSVDGEVEHAQRRLTEIDGERVFYQRQAARGKMTEGEFDARMRETEDARRYWGSELNRLQELRDSQARVRTGLDYVAELLTNLQVILHEIDVPPKKLRKLPQEKRNEILEKRRGIVLALVDEVTVYADGQLTIDGLLDGSEAAQFGLADWSSARDRV